MLRTQVTEVLKYSNKVERKRDAINGIIQQMCYKDGGSADLDIRVADK